MSYWLRRRCSRSCQRVYGSPATEVPHWSGGTPSTMRSSPGWASSHPSSRARCSRSAWSLMRSGAGPFDPADPLDDREPNPVGLAGFLELVLSLEGVLVPDVARDFQDT